MPSHRALIRAALVRVCQEDAGLAAGLAGRVWPNRMEHWLADELPATGVYTLTEEVLETEISPDPLERRVALVVEILARAGAGVDDTLDALTWDMERALTLDSVGAAMTAIANEALTAAGKDPLPPVVAGGIARTSAVDTLLTLKLTSTEIGIAVEGDRQIGVAAMNFDLEYALPQTLSPALDFLLAVSSWDVQAADGVIDMEGRAEFEPTSTTKE